MSIFLVTLAALFLLLLVLFFDLFFKPFGREKGLLFGVLTSTIIVLAISRLVPAAAVESQSSVTFLHYSLPAVFAFTVAYLTSRFNVDKRLSIGLAIAVAAAVFFFTPTKASAATLVESKPLTGVYVVYYNPQFSAWGYTFVRWASMTPGCNVDSLQYSRDQAVARDGYLNQHHVTPLYSCVPQS